MQSNRRMSQQDGALRGKKKKDNFQIFQLLKFVGTLMNSFMVPGFTEFDKLFL